jgi:hypothetical protein
VVILNIFFVASSFLLKGKEFHMAPPVLLDKFIFRKMAQFDSPVKLCPSGPKRVGMVYSGRNV